MDEAVVVPHRLAFDFGSRHHLYRRAGDRPSDLARAAVHARPMPSPVDPAKGQRGRSHVPDRPQGRALRSVPSRPGLPRRRHRGHVRVRLHGRARRGDDRLVRDGGTVRRAGARVRGAREAREEGPRRWSGQEGLQEARRQVMVRDVTLGVAWGSRFLLLPETLGLAWSVLLLPYSSRNKEASLWACVLALFPGDALHKREHLYAGVRSMGPCTPLGDVPRSQNVNVPNMSMFPKMSCDGLSYPSAPRYAQNAKTQKAMRLRSTHIDSRALRTPYTQKECDDRRLQEVDLST